MSTHLTLKAADGHSFAAYRADPSGTAKAALIVVQEIFGVNHHIRAVCDRLAAQGYVAIAPALFDRLSPNFESGYSAPEVEHARGFIPNINWDHVMLDIEASVTYAKTIGKVGMIGFCFGGSVSYMSALKMPIDVAICCYGGQIVRHADHAPACPTQMHFGDQDASIPISDVETIIAKRPDCDVHVYHAGHGFMCDERGSYHAECAAQAWSRSLSFLQKHLN
jgi:carboxymethylenebutenolidase